MKKLIVTSILINLFAICAFAQTSEFTYQGSLKDGSNPANANYDFEFALYDSLSGGTQLGSTLTRNSVAVSNGSFAVKLDFGSQFPGANRFLEIRVRLTGQPGITTLSPRQQISNAPYAVRSLNAGNADNATNATNATNAINATTATNALQLGGVAANQYVLTTDPRMSDPRAPTAGSGNYIQNTTTPQSASLSILGNATFGATASGININAESSFNFRGGRLLALGGFGFRNLYLGTEAGLANPSSTQFNSFVGYGAGRASTGGSLNSFFGAESGGSTTQGESNTFVGTNAGFLNTTGSFNTFLGRSAGIANIGGGDNTAIGNNANFASGNLTNATAIGAGSVVTSSNTIVLGRSNGADTVQIPGALNVTGTFTGTVLNATTANNALNLGGVPAAQFVQTTDGRLSDARNPLPGSTDYIQNGTAQQSSSNFNISGNGAVGGMFGIGQPSPTFPLSFASTLGDKISLWPNGAASYGFGIQSSLLQVHTDISAADIGFGYGSSAAFTENMRIKGNGRVGIGTSAPVGSLHINVPGSGTPISALTVDVGTFGTGGNAVNSYFFKVRDLGLGGTPAFLIRGDGNVGIGTAMPSDRFHVVGSSTFSGNVNVNATAGIAGNLNVGGNGVFNGSLGIGVAPSSKLHISGPGIVRALVSSDSNAGLQLGLNNAGKWSVATVDPGNFQIYNDAIGQNAFWIDRTSNNVAIGTTITAAKLQVDGGNGRGLLVTTNNPGDFVAQFGGTGAFAIDDATNGGGRLMVLNNGTTQINIPGTTGETAVRLNVNGSIKLNMIPEVGLSVCWMGGTLNTLVACGVSSIRYKDNINNFVGGLDLVRRLRPVTFNWKSNGKPDMGLVAEEVAKEEPLLAVYDDKGEVQGVKYDRIGVVAINAIKEQQAQIERQQAQIEALQKQIDVLTKLVCSLKPSTEICKEKE